MTHCPCSKLVARFICTALASLSCAVLADEASGKVVWIDKKNSTLLLECPDKGCLKIPDAKAGETYTFVIPASIEKKVASLKEGQVITIVYYDGKENGYVITSINEK